jgi:hypothetical protein
VGSGKYLSGKEFRGLKEFEKHCITLYMVACRRNSDKEERRALEEDMHITENKRILRQCAVAKTIK